MTKAVRIVTRGVLALLALFVGAAIWLTWGFDANDFKPAIEGLIRARTGLNVRLDGAIHHRMADELTVAFDDVKVMAGGAVAARVDRLRLRLALAPLLAGRLVIDDLALDIAAAHVVRDASGRLSFIEGDRRGRNGDATLRGVSVRVATLTFRDAVEEIDWTLEDLALDISALPRLEAHAPPHDLGADEARGHLRIGVLRGADLRVRNLGLGFESRDGEIRLSDAGAELAWTSGAQGEQVTLEAHGSTTLRLVHDQAADGKPGAGLAGLQRLDLETFEAHVAHLVLMRGAARYALVDAQVQVEALPLILEGRPLGEIMTADANRFFAETDLRVAVAATSLEAPGLRFADLDLALATEAGALEVAIGRLHAAVEPLEGVQPLALETALHGHARLIPRFSEGLQPRPVLALEGLLVDRADLTIEQLELGLEDERYAAREVRLVLARLPLLQDDHLLGEPGAAGAGEPLDRARVELTAAAVETGGPALADLTLRATGAGKDVTLERLALQVDGTPISGDGRLVLEGGALPWELALRADALDIASLLGWLGAKTIDARGEVNVNATIAGRGIAPSEVTIVEGNARSTGLAIAAEGTRYRIHGLRTDIGALPLVRAGRMMDLRDRRTLRRLGGRTTLSLAVQRVEGADLVLEDLSMRARGGGSHPRIEALSVRVAGSRLSGGADLDLDTPSPTWRLRVGSDRLALGPLIDRLGRGLEAAGEASLQAELEGQGLGRIGGGSHPLPEQVTLRSARLRTPRLTVTRGNDAYRITALELEAGGTPLVADGRLLDPLDLRQRKAMLAETGMRLKAGSIQRGGQRIEQVSAGLQIADDTLTIEPFSLRAGGATLSGELRWRPRSQPPTWALEIDGRQVPLGPAFAMLGADVDAQGTFDIDAHLRARGMDKPAWLTTLTGSASLAMRDVAFRGADLDALLSTLEATGRAGLLNVGALALGPFAAIVTSSLRLVGRAGTADRTGTTRILQSQISIAADSGVMTFEDVAFATPRHRVALTGGLDLATGELRDMQLATLNARGCARYVEQIRGTLDAPKVSATSLVAKTLTAPVTKIVKGVAGLLGPACTPVYTGAVAPPASPP